MHKGIYFFKSDLFWYSPCWGNLYSLFDHLARMFLKLLQFLKSPSARKCVKLQFKTITWGPSFAFGTADTCGLCFLALPLGPMLHVLQMSWLHLWKWCCMHAFVCPSFPFGTNVTCGLCILDLHLGQMVYAINVFWASPGMIVEPNPIKYLHRYMELMMHMVWVS